jgi:hypothetical protein
MVVVGTSMMVEPNKAIAAVVGEATRIDALLLLPAFSFCNAFVG